MQSARGGEAGGLQIHGAVVGDPHEYGIRGRAQSCSYRQVGGCIGGWWACGVVAWQYLWDVQPQGMWFTLVQPAGHVAPTGVAHGVFCPWLLGNWTALP